MTPGVRGVHLPSEALLEPLGLMKPFVLLGPLELPLLPQQPQLLLGPLAPLGPPELQEPLEPLEQALGLEPLKPLRHPGAHGFMLPWDTFSS